MPIYRYLVLNKSINPEYIEIEQSLKDAPLAESVTSDRRTYTKGAGITQLSSSTRQFGKKNPLS